jgi:hypothetical protein
MAVTHQIRSRDKKVRTVNLTPIRAIRFFCVECMGFNDKEVKVCTSPLCPLYPFRMGKSLSGRVGRSKNSFQDAFQKAGYDHLS